MSKLISFLASVRKFSLSSRLTSASKSFLLSSSNFLIRRSLAVLSFSRCPSYSKNSLISARMVLVSLSVNTLFVLVAVVRLAVGVLAFWVDTGAVKFSKRFENKSAMPNSSQLSLHSFRSASKACNLGDTPRTLFNFSWRSSISAKSCCSRFIMSIIFTCLINTRFIFFNFTIPL